MFTKFTKVRSVNCEHAPHHICHQNTRQGTQQDISAPSYKLLTSKGTKKKIKR